MSDTLIVIPARIGSERLKDKPLRTIDGTPLITHVCYRALEADVGEVILSSDDEMVLQCAPKGVYAICIKTGPWEHCGSDRVAYVSESLGDPCPHVINLQGDLPFIDPHVIRDLAATRQASKADIVTARSGLSMVEATTVAMSRNFRKLHVGIYAFTADSLERFAAFGLSDRERLVKLEQLRANDNGMSIEYIDIDHMPLEINTEADLKHANLIARCIWRDADAGVGH